MGAPYAQIITKSSEEVLNLCTKYLARGAKLFQNQFSKDASNLTVISENWRFPVVQPTLNDRGQVSAVNEVIFIYKGTPDDQVEITGSFAPLYQSFPLQPVLFEGQNIGYYYLAVKVPTGKGYYYRFSKNGVNFNDPVNPQTTTLLNGVQWSYFFTDYFNYTGEFESWELRVLFRMVLLIVPFRSKEAQNFINRFYLSMAKPDQLAMPIYKLDSSVGEVNYITNILAREERHHLTDYKICLAIIDQLMRARNPYIEPWQVSDQLYSDLYNQIASGNTVPDWDYSKYANPVYFLGLVRRHTITGAFSHPRYGGNIGGAGWDYLKNKYVDTDAQGLVTATYFDWERSIEAPLGVNSSYSG